MKILFLTSRFPYPLEKGDKLRAFNFIKCLSQHHEVHLFAISEYPVSRDMEIQLSPYCSSIEVALLKRHQIAINLLKACFNGLPFQVSYFTFSEAKNLFAQKVDMLKPDIIFCHLIRVAELVKNISHPCKILDYMDTFSMGMLRRYVFDKSPLQWLWKWEYQKLIRYERDIFFHFQKHIIISEQDKNLLRIENKNSVTVVPNGVNFNDRKNVAKVYDVIFAGNMSYLPNIDAVLFLVNNVMPLVWEKIPYAKVVIAGANPARKVKKLACEKVEVTGWVEDINYYFMKSKILVAPMRTGIGLQNKLLEAMSAGLPCITSELANSALRAERGKHILVADKPWEYAEAIVNLLENSELYQSISAEGYRFVLEKYSWHKICYQLNEVINTIQ
ncbi:MAG: glycosyltransferase [Chitinophagales bacterium]|nr:glycosyltransferase [Chitinophagales bacterium]